MVKIVGFCKSRLKEHSNSHNGRLGFSAIKALQPHIYCIFADQLLKRLLSVSLFGLNNEKKFRHCNPEIWKNLQVSLLQSITAWHPAVSG